MKVIAKKTTILYVFKVLYCYTSREHTVTQTQITHYLNDLGIPCDRKTVGRNIGYLIEAGFPVHRVEGKIPGYYYNRKRNDFFALHALSSENDRQQSPNSY